MSGWYVLARGWRDHPDFEGEALSRADAWVWLIEAAAFSERRVKTRLGEVVLRRGQLTASMRQLARTWRWSEASVRRCLDAFTRSGKIDAVSDAGQTVITVCNYDQYQVRRGAADAQGDAPDARHCVGDALTDAVTVAENDALGDADADAASNLANRSKNTEKHHAPEIADAESDALPDAEDDAASVASATHYKKERRKKEINNARGGAPARGYAFAGRTIRLMPADYDRWLKTYHAIPDLRAALGSLDDWFQGQPEDRKKRWFHTVSGCLGRDHQKILAERRPEPPAACGRMSAADRVRQADEEAARLDAIRDAERAAAAAEREGTVH